MPPAASWALGGQKPPSVSASSPYVTDPPSTGLPLSLGMFLCAPVPPPPPPPPPQAAAMRAKPAPTATIRSHRLRVTSRYESRTSRPPKSIGTSAPPRPQSPGRLDRPVECDGRHSRCVRPDVNRGRSAHHGARKPLTWGFGGVAGCDGYRARGDGGFADRCRKAGACDGDGGRRDMRWLRVTGTCAIPLDELEWRFSGPGGPGGQHAK